MGPIQPQTDAWGMGMNYLNNVFGTSMNQAYPYPYLQGGSSAPTYGMDAANSFNQPPIGNYPYTGGQYPPYYGYPDPYTGIPQPVPGMDTVKFSPWGLEPSAGQQSQYPRGYDSFGNSPQAIAQHEAATQAYRDYSANMAGDPNAPFLVNRGTGENPYLTASDYMAQHHPDLPELKNATIMTSQAPTSGLLGGGPTVGGKGGGGMNVPQTGGELPVQGTQPGQFDNQLTFDAVSGANQALVQGGPQAGMYGGIAPQSQANLNMMFSGPRQMIGDAEATFNPLAYTPNVPGSPITANPNPAIQELLSGQPDYSGVAGATAAAARPMFDALREEVLPSLRSSTNVMTNPTGEIKEQNRIIPRMLRDVGDIGAQMSWSEYARAKNAMQPAAALATQAQLQGQGLGLEGYGLGLQGAGMFSNLGLQSDLAQQGAWDRYRGDTLGYGDLTSNIGSALSKDLLSGSALAPQTIQQGMMPSQYMSQFGDWMSNFGQKAINEDMARYNYYENLPLQMQQYMSGILSGAGGLGGTQTMSGGTNPLLGGAGGALAGAGMSSMLGANAMAGGTTGLLGTATMPFLWPLLIGGGLLGAFG